jgi:hypothetical protein
MFADDVAQVMTNIAGGATVTISEGFGYYKCSDGKTAMDTVYVVSCHSQTIYKLMTALEEWFEEYLYTTGEESILVIQNGSAGYYTLD